MLVSNVLGDGEDEFLGVKDLEIFLVASMGHGGAIQHLAAVLDIGDLSVISCSEKAFRRRCSASAF
jgi:hypothetical protein